MDINDKIATHGAAAGDGRRRIILQFGSFRDFIQEFSAQISADGMFVHQPDLPAPAPAVGEELDFEVRLDDDFRLVYGSGELAWYRGAPDPGAAIRFIEMDEASRRLASRLADNYTKDGGNAFDLSAAPDILVAPPMSSAHEETEPSTEEEPQVWEITDPAEESFADDPALASAAEPLEPEPVETEGADSLFADDDGAAVPEEELEVLPVPEPPVPVESETPHALESNGIEPPVEPVETPLLNLDANDLEVDDDAGESETVVTTTDAEVPRPVIPEDIAQLADELSGVHQMEPPAPTPPPAPGPQPVQMPDEPSEISVYSDAEEAGRPRRPWRVLLLASLAGILLGVAAWNFFGTRLMEMIGLGPRSGVETMAVAPAQEPAAFPEEPMPDATATGAEELSPGQTMSDNGLDAGPSGGVGETAEGADGDDAEVVQSESGVVAESEMIVPEPVAEPAGTASAPADDPAAEPTTSGNVPVSSVQNISWLETTEGTIVTIEFDGVPDESMYEVIRVRDGAPREVVKLRGIAEPYAVAAIDVGSSTVQRMRIGHHAAGGGEVHVVFDLSGPGASVTLVQVEGNRLVVTIS